MKNKAPTDRLLKISHASKQPLNHGEKTTDTGQQQYNERPEAMDGPTSISNTRWRRRTKSKVYATKAMTCFMNNRGKR
jgi:hypothetical protein